MTNKEKAMSLILQLIERGENLQKNARFLMEKLDDDKCQEEEIRELENFNESYKQIGTNFRIFVKCWGDEIL